jgi:hypothetical protein
MNTRSLFAAFATVFAMALTAHAQTERVCNSPTSEKWDGRGDKSWYSEDETEFILCTAEELAGVAKLVNAGTFTKTVVVR